MMKLNKPKPEVDLDKDTLFYIRATNENLAKLTSLVDSFVNQDRTAHLKIDQKLDTVAKTHETLLMDIGELKKAQAKDWIRFVGLGFAMGIGSQVPKIFELLKALKGG